MKIFISIVCAGFLLVAVNLCAAQESLTITLPAVEEQGTFPDKFTCRGADVNPEIHLAHVPTEAKSLALVMVNTDAPEGIWTHWVVYNISPGTSTIAEHSKPGIEGFNDYATFRYRGPCPQNQKKFHYSLRVYALKEKLDLNEGFIRTDLEAAMKGKILAEAQWVGVYQNSEDIE